MKVCSICKRGSLRAKSRSHSNIATIRRQYLNLHTKWVKGRKTKVCSKCLKTASKY